MDKQDLLLSHLFARVKRHVEPEDHPASSSELAQDTNLSVEYTVALCEELAREGFVVMSTLNIPPLVYITLPGIARARRMDTAFSALDRKSA
ncbi:hypothetical protein [Rufibacter sp. XAAS-G3-1]|uniref:hypothetical protein n=1 Tax=Rufibacter sp. XAAS-G3-1 TaxID=2729134 RepID=UPI0015E6B735|nr:hypothetical protein [Rufibacter sp. XAAS-G3-1]